MEKKKSKENNSNDIKELSTIEHILIRPNTYLGGTKPAQFMEWVLDENDKLVCSWSIQFMQMSKEVNELD